MECKKSDSKKLYKVFDATKRNRKQKKGLDESNSDSDGSKSLGLGPQNSKHLLNSEIPNELSREKKHSSAGSSSGVFPTSPARLKAPRTPRRVRKRGKGEISLALKSGFASTPRSESPEQSTRTALPQQTAPDALGAEQNSFIYDFLEEAIKKDKKRHKHHSRRPERKPMSVEADELRESHRRRRRARREHHVEDGSIINQTALLDTFIKICSQFQGQPVKQTQPAPIEIEVTRPKSNKSLQCEYNNSEIDQQPTRLRDDTVPPQHQYRNKLHNKYSESGSIDNGGKLSRNEQLSLNTARCEENEPRLTKSRDYLKNYDDRRHFDEKGPRYDDRGQIHADRGQRYDDRRPRYDDRGAQYNDRFPKYDDRPCRERNSDERPAGERQFEDRLSRDRYDGRYERRRHCDERDRDYRRIKDKNCVICKEDEARERYQERERANGDLDSLMSGAEVAESLRSVNADSGFELPHHLSASVGPKTRQKACKQSVCLDPAIQQELCEQREALDKMIRLWQELMKRFKDVAINVDRSEKAVQDTAATQMRLWRECMQRYETVARDVGDTDARLMDELNKQKAEMQQMSGVWQECLTRYREMSANLTTLKQQMSPEPPPPPPAARAPPPAAPDGEGSPMPHPYRVQQPPPGYPVSYGGSPVRSRVSAPAAMPPPPNWCWSTRGGAHSPPPGWGWGGGASAHSPPPRRHSSLDSRSEDSRGKRRERRRHRNREAERSDAHHRKERSTSKVNPSRSDRKHRR